MMKKLKAAGETAWAWFKRVGYPEFAGYLFIVGAIAIGLTADDNYGFASYALLTFMGVVMLCLARIAWMLAHLTTVFALDDARRKLDVARNEMTAAMNAQPVHGMVWEVERANRMREGRVFLVWSNEHMAYWRENRSGYTDDLAQAGRYTEQEADTICLQAKQGTPLPNGLPHEVKMLDPMVMYG